MKRTKLYDQAIQVYGPDAQVKMLLEEMAELQVSILKSIRSKQADSPENKALVLTELVDVDIMVEQMRVLYSISSKDYDNHKRYKKRRLTKRLADELNKQEKIDTNIPGILVGQYVFVEGLNHLIESYSTESKHYILRGSDDRALVSDVERIRQLPVGCEAAFILEKKHYENEGIEPGELADPHNLLTNGGRKDGGTI